MTIVDTETNAVVTRASMGTGPVDAAYKAVAEVVGATDIDLLEYAVGSVTAGIDALAEVTVRVEDKTTKRIFYGRSANNDVIAASTQAYLNALNRALANRKTGIRTHSHSSPSS